jgi:imidazolonepropionase-like amidohydrolase
MAPRCPRRGGLAALATAAILGLTWLAWPAAPLAQGPAPTTFAVRNVTLIDGTGASAAPGTTIVVSNGRVTAVGRDAAVPAGARVVDGTGKFVIPGLWDMHLHLRGDARVPGINTYGEALLLANGVTGVRIMAGLPEFHRIQRDVTAGKALGPRIFISSRNMDGLIPRQPLPPRRGDTAGEAQEWTSVGTGEIPRAYQITNREQAKAAVAEAKASGVEFVKIHNDLTPQAYDAIAAEAKANGLYLVGHAPTGVSVAALAASGMRSIEHFPGMLEGCSSREDELLKASLAALELPPADRARRTAEIRRMAVDSFNADRCRALAAKLVANRTWLSPTFMPGGGVRALSERNADLAKYVFAPLRARWMEQAAGAATPAAPTPAEQELAKAAETLRLQIVGIMTSSGVPYVIGTDAGGAWRIPGRSLHEGLAEMVRAGLTPMQAIQAATLSSARLLGREKELGSVQVGKYADLVVLDANPIDQVANTRRINAVVVNGRLLDRQALDSMLTQLETAQAR